MEIINPKMEKTKKEPRRCFFTNEQLNYIQRHILEEETNIFKYSVDPNKVMAVKRYLDDNFVRGQIPTMGEDGYPKTLYIVGMKGSDGNIMKNMSARQLFYLLQDKFSKIYMDKSQRDKFLKQVMVDWYNKKISKEGLLSKNRY